MEYTWNKLETCKLHSYLLFHCRFNVDLDQFPIINQIMDALETEEAFIKAHPQQQPDAQ